MRISLKTLTSLLIVVALTGCAASVTRGTPQTTKIAASEVAAKRVLLSMTGPAGRDSGPDWDAFKEEWQTSLTAALATSGGTFSFNEATAATSGQPSILLKMKVNDYRYVSQAKRYGLGVFTGNAYLDIDVEFLVMPVNQSLGSRNYSSSSSFIHGVFAAMTPKQVEAVAKEIAQELSSK